MSEKEREIYNRYMLKLTLTMIGMSPAEQVAFSKGMQHVVDQLEELGQVWQQREKDGLPEEIENLSMNEFNEFMRKQLE